MSIASQIIQEAGKRNRSRDWYRSMLMTALQNYQGAEYDDPGEFGEVSGPVGLVNYTSSTMLQLNQRS